MRRLFVAAVALGCLIALVGACFGAVLFAGQQFEYRDSGHFYYPLYLRVQQEWDAGRVPLWEPEENGGMPLLGNPTAAVLYPGKIIYAALPYDWAVRVYIIAHTLLAFATMYGLLRSWSVSRTGAFLSGLSYAFGAPILFQYCNVIFLVAAAWVPFGLMGADAWIRRGRRSGLLSLSVSLAMQSLGGDLQTAYVTGLCAAGYALGMAWAGRPGRRLAPAATVALFVLAAALWVAVSLILAYQIPIWLVGSVGGRVSTVSMSKVTQPWPPWIPRELFPGRDGLTWLLSPQFWRMIVQAAWGIAAACVIVRWLKRRSLGSLDVKLIGLGGAALLAATMMAAQLLPVVEYGRRTVRAAPEGTHEVFPFSQEPYRVLELLWPTFFGSSFGANRSWLPAIARGGTPKIWVPSLYIGGLTIILALGAATFRAADPRRAWLTWILALSLLASAGAFGSPIWLARNFRGVDKLIGKHDGKTIGETRMDGCARDGDGSLYWLLAWGLPDFSSFRYPSKMFTFSCVALSGLAGFGWDFAGTARRRCMLWLAVGLGALGIILLGVSFLVAEPVVRFWSNAPLSKGGSPWGPFDGWGGMADLRSGLVHGTIAIGLGAVAIGLASRRPALGRAIALTVLTIDLIVANAGFVETADASVFHGEPEVLTRIKEAERANPGDGPYRIHRMPLWNPASWSEQESGERVADFTRWERKTIQPKYGITEGAVYTLTEGTAELFDYWFFFAPFHGNHDEKVGRSMGLRPNEKAVYFPRRGYNLWNSRYFVLPYVFRNDEGRGIASFMLDVEPIYPAKDAFDGPDGAKRKEEWAKKEDWQIVRNKDAFPRAWVVHDAIFVPPITDMSRQSRARWMEQMLYQADVYWSSSERRVYDPRALAWVEADETTKADLLSHYLTRAATDPNEAPVFTRYEPQHVELDVNMVHPGILVLADVYYPGWQLTIDGKPAEILRVNRVMRGAAVPSGKHHLVYRFDPQSFRVGKILSGLGLFVFVLAGVWAFRQPSDAPV